MTKVVAGVALALVLLVIGAAPAAAHAELEGTEPASGSVLDAAPTRIVLRFSEPVETSARSVRIVAAGGAEVDVRRIANGNEGADTVEAELGDLDDGTYVVAWRVTSADAHPVRGAFTFSVGEAGTADASELAARLLAGGEASSVTRVALGVARGGVFAGLLVLVGVTFFAVAFRPESPRWWALVVVAFVVAVVASVAAVVLQADYSGDTVAGVIAARYGRVSVVRLGLLGLSVPLLVFIKRRQRPPAVLVAGAIVAVGLLLTPGLAGHATTGRWLPIALVVDVVHLVAAAVWLGGIAVIVFAAPGLDAIKRFSNVALVSVVVIFVTGTVQSVRQVGYLDAVTGTWFGRVLVVKVAAVLAMVGLAGLSRLRLRGRDSGVRQTVLGEALAAVAVVAMTTVLVDAIPARTDLERPFATTIEAGSELLVDVTIDPAAPGPVDLHLYTLTPTGSVAEAQTVEASIRLPADGIGPVEVPLQRAGPGHFAAYGFDVPVPGEWRLDVTVRTTDIDQERGSTTIPVR